MNLHPKACTTREDVCWHERHSRLFLSMCTVTRSWKHRAMAGQEIRTRSDSQGFCNFIGEHLPGGFHEPILMKQDEPNPVKRFQPRPCAGRTTWDLRPTSLLPYVQTCCTYVSEIRKHSSKGLGSLFRPVVCRARERVLTLSLSAWF